MAMMALWLRWAWLRCRLGLGLGPAGVAGVLLLGVGLALLLQAAEARRQARSVTAALKTAAPAARMPLTAPATPVDDLPAFYAALPQQRALPLLLDQVFKAAGRQRLQLAAGQYQLLRDERAGVLRYRLQLPVAGRYEQIAGFVGDVLQRMPTLAVESIDLKRERIETEALTAELQLSLLLRPDPVQEPAP
ncbi:type 4a pilus biogenesis protein PilO [Chitiniphilus purpureus]|uniref:Type 4a pilus biogenesis protein PilO n=1 Tax=Chitiniphilus purpureus TaxID=2981137 RepID=A0ABY6DLH9_9NEIS|nr:type 4a pilus biogenesis protein PilO [Chitiniphilus sp. CD1]UXY15217.1 type 4a pilus biogenesis protein PilO [Chitiniphilus sp. CD1]